MSNTQPIEAIEAEGAIQALHIPVALIDRDPAQPRTHFDDVALAELAESIRAHGVIQPVEVEATGDGRYRLHHGERRWRAALLAGHETIPAVVAPPRAADEALVRGLIENLHREDLNPIEEARVYKRLLDAGWTRLRIARETGRGQATVTSRLEWLQMEPEIQELVALGRLSRDARLVAAFRVLTPEVRVPLAQKLAARGVGWKGCIAAAERAAEAIAAKAEAHVQAEARRAATAARIAGPNGRMNGHGANGHGRPASVPATPMLALGAPGYAGGRGSAPVLTATVAEAAEAMCRSCNIRPRGDIIPVWQILEEEARRTCAACQKRDGAARLDVCRLCPGVEMVRRLVAGQGVS